jgi:hypothetical protein
VQADDAALANSTREAQICLADRAGFTLAAAPSNGRHHPIAGPQLVHAWSDLEDAPDRFMAQHQEWAALGQTSRWVEYALDDVAIGPAHADAQHLHQYVISFR